MTDLDVEIHSYFQNRIREAHAKVIRVTRYSFGPNTFGVDCYDAKNNRKGMQFARGFWEERARHLADVAEVGERDRLYILADLIFHEVHEFLLKEGW